MKIIRLSKAFLDAAEAAAEDYTGGGSFIGPNDVAPLESQQKQLRAAGGRLNESLQGSKQTSSWKGPS